MKKWEMRVRRSYQSEFPNNSGQLKLGLTEETQKQY